MTDIPTPTPAGSTSPANSQLSAPGKSLDERVRDLEENAKKVAQRATIIAVLAALFGGGGLAGTIQWLAGSRLREAEVTLSDQQKKINEQDMRLKSQDMRLKEQDARLKQQLGEHDVALKAQARQIGEYEVKLKGLALHRDEFNDRLSSFNAATASLERGIAAARQSGSTQGINALVQELIQQNREFSQFAAQTRRYVEELPGAPGWYRQAVAQAEAASRQHDQHLQRIKNELSGPGS